MAEPQIWTDEFYSLDMEGSYVTFINERGERTPELDDVSHMDPIQVVAPGSTDGELLHLLMSEAHVMVCPKAVRDLVGEAFGDSVRWFAARLLDRPYWVFVPPTLDPEEVQLQLHSANWIVPGGLRIATEALMPIFNVSGLDHWTFVSPEFAEAIRYHGFLGYGFSYFGNTIGD